MVILHLSDILCTTFVYCVGISLTTNYKHNPYWESENYFFDVNAIKIDYRPLLNFGVTIVQTAVALSTIYCSAYIIHV